MPKKTAEELLEDLAQMVKRGFDETATKSEFHNLRSDMERGFQAIAETFDLIRQDLRGACFPHVALTQHQFNPKMKL